MSLKKFLTAGFVAASVAGVFASSASAGTFQLAVRPLSLSNTGETLPAGASYVAGTNTIQLAQSTPAATTIRFGVWLHVNGNIDAADTLTSVDFGVFSRQGATPLFTAGGVTGAAAVGVAVPAGAGENALAYGASGGGVASSIGVRTVDPDMGGPLTGAANGTPQTGTDTLSDWGPAAGLNSNFITQMGAGNNVSGEWARGRFASAQGLTTNITTGTQKDIVVIDGSNTEVLMGTFTVTIGSALAAGGTTQFYPFSFNNMRGSTLQGGVLGTLDGNGSGNVANSTSTAALGRYDWAQQRNLATADYATLYNSATYAFDPLTYAGANLLPITLTNAVPEPSTFALLGLAGLAGAFGLRRRQK